MQKKIKDEPFFGLRDLFFDGKNGFLRKRQAFCVMACENRHYSWKDNRDRDNLPDRLAFDNHTAARTAVTGFSAVSLGKLLKISAPYLMDLQTFRAATASKLVFGNNQMTMPAPKLIVFKLYEREDLVFAGGHKDIIM